jgi:hypothetical protein
MPQIMQSPPPRNAMRITPGKIIGTKLRVGRLLAKRAQALCKGRTGWWGDNAVIYALWLHLEQVVATMPDAELEDAANRFLSNPNND